MKRLLFAALALALGLSSPVLAANLANPDYVVIVKPGTVVVSSALENGHILQAGPGVLVDLQANFVTCASAPCWILLFDQLTLPVNGTVAPVGWYQATANSQTSISGLRFAKGIVVVCSTTGPFTLTLSTQCVYRATIQ